MATYVISDLHLGHKSILRFSPERGGTTVDEHDEWIIEQWNKTVLHKHDVVWILGDVAFSQIALHKVCRLKGYKNLVRGNHDTQSTQAYLKYFNNVFGITKVSGMWLSHAPIHPQELRGRANVHGHVHNNSIRDVNGELDPRYMNVCVEALNGIPVLLDDLIARARLLPKNEKFDRGHDE